jgi:hypothetical protein
MCSLSMRTSLYEAKNSILGCCYIIGKVPNYVKYELKEVLKYLWVGISNRPPSLQTDTDIVLI